MKPLLEVINLRKSYKEKKVIHDISFNIYQGEILCFLGPNGAGKSTTINIICGALGYDVGEILFKGQPITKRITDFKEKLGIVPQNLAIYEDLSAEENIKFFASLYGLKGTLLREGLDFALKATGLNQHRKELVNTFSGGMKRRLNIACAIAHQPELLIMDEPTVGIDPQSRNHILDSIRYMQQQGMTVLYTTHYMEEVEEISTRIIIMDHGKIIVEGTKESLKKMSGEKNILIELDSPEGFNLDCFYQLEGITNVKQLKQQLFISTIQGIENLDKIIHHLLLQQQKIQNIEIRSNTLETIFLDLTGRSLRD